MKITTPLQSNVITPVIAHRIQKYIGTGPQKNWIFCRSVLLIDTTDMMDYGREESDVQLKWTYLKKIKINKTDF